MAIAVKKSAKIKPYKFVDTKVSINRDAPEDQKEIVKGLQQQQKAINNLGNTLNSIAAVLQDFRDNQAKQIKLQEASIPKFQAKYTTREASAKKNLGGDIATPSMSSPDEVGFLESLMSFLKNTVGAAVGVAALNWMSDEKNRTAVRNTINLMVNIMKAIVGFVSRETKEFINDMYTILSDETTGEQKLTTVFKSLGKFAVGFLAIRYLKNPVKLVKDFGSVLGFFNKNLLNSRNVLIRRASKITALAAGALLLAKAFQKKDEIKENAQKAYGGTKSFLQDTEQAATNVVQNRASGGAVPLRAGGGWIQGPQTGYPVSLDGGRSTSFIGHGTEYVVQKANGGFVIPVDTPATRGNPNLTDLRMSQASAAGYNLGGMFDSMASGGRRRKRGEKEGEEASKGFRYGKLMASGGGISLTSNGGRPLVNKKLLAGQQYKFSDLMSHSHNVTSATVYDGIGMGPGKDYGVGKLPQYMPSGPNGLIPTPQAGEVLRAGDINNGYGKSVLVKGPLGVMGFHHLSRIASGVRQGGRVSAGKIVGTQGATGGNYAEHLHLNATPKGHEAFVNYITTGKPTTGKPTTGSSTGGRQSTSALNLTGAAKERTTPQFIAKLVQMCKRLRCDPSDMLAKMASESGLNPNQSHSGGATGLIQFKSNTWSGLGTGKPFSWLKTASAVEQLPYIEKFLKPSFDKAPKGANGMVSSGHVYVSTFLPAFAGDPEDTVIATRDGSGVKGFSASQVKGWYKFNAGLDGYDPVTGKIQSPDGKITIKELAGRLAAKKKEFGISGGVTTGQTQVSMSSSGDVIPPSGLQSSTSAPAPQLTVGNAMQTFAGGLAEFAKVMGADIDVDAFKQRFAGLAPGSNTKPGVTGSGGSSNIGPIASGDSYASMLKNAPGMGDGSGTDAAHFRKSSGGSGGSGASKIRPVKPSSIASMSSRSGGGGGSTASPSLGPVSTPTKQKSMVDQTKLNISSRQGTPTTTTKIVAAEVAKANQRVRQLQIQSAQSIADANKAAQPTHVVRTQKSSGDNISLVDQLNSVNNILG